MRLDGRPPGFVRDLEGLATRDLSNDDVSFHALREYVPGDDLRHVHWRSTARTGRLMIRQFEETRRSQFVIVVSTRPADYADDDEFEVGIAVAASLSRSAQVDGKEVTVYSTDAGWSGRTPAACWTSTPASNPVRQRSRLGRSGAGGGRRQPRRIGGGLVTGSR